MIDALYMILRPFAYLQIRHPEKRKFDWIFPGAMAIVSLLIVCAFIGLDKIYLKDGLVEKLVSLLQILPGFYIAALAAIATFQKSNIDELMPDPTPSVDIKIRGQQNTIDLTRRRFLSMLFAFLAAESVLLSFFMVLVSQSEFQPVLTSWLDFPPITTLFFWRGIGALIILFGFWQIITATLLGLYYLGDRLHQPNV